MTNRATNPPPAPEAEPERQQAARFSLQACRLNKVVRQHGKGSLAVGSKPARASLMTSVIVCTRKAATGEEHPSRLTNHRRSPATTQTREIVPERFRLIACTHLVPIPHGKARRSGTEQGMDILLTPHRMHQWRLFSLQGCKLNKGGTVDIL